MTSVDAVLELIHKENRRYALYYLDNQEAPVSVDELAEGVAMMKSEVDIGRIPDDVIEEYETQLRHVDIPKATEARFVEFDSEEGVVQLTDEPPTFEALLKVAEVLETPRE